MSFSKTLTLFGEHSERQPLRTFLKQTENTLWRMRSASVPAAWRFSN